jgi:7,8-dihydropterin-6-yl-methyl-4-(beta-D-ribofuranosyl)aminobenzene 5'-phosphate synthase
MRRILTSVILPLTIVAVLLVAPLLIAGCARKEKQIMNDQSESESKAIKDLSVTVIYDNNPHNPQLETAWGFSCLVTGTGKTILFDTGGDSRLLLSNMKKLKIAPNTVDVIMLSHIHGDHTGGLQGFLKNNLNVTVYLPKSFPEKFKDKVRDSGAEIIEVQQPLKICKNVYSTGQLGRLIKEHSLIVQTDKGLIVITGCAHPGIVKIVKAAKDFLKDDILLVMGGFHLEWMTKGKIEKIISAFKESGVRHVAPCHCSGDKARALFEKHFGKNYINIGAGKTINITDLE